MTPKELEYRHKQDPRMKETVIINPWSSKCGNCGEDCSYSEAKHLTNLGYGPQNGTPGCGVEWKYVTTEYLGKREEEASKACRPDLEFYSDFNFSL